MSEILKRLNIGFVERVEIGENFIQVTHTSVGTFAIVADTVHHQANYSLFQTKWALYAVFENIVHILPHSIG